MAFIRKQALFWSWSCNKLFGAQYKDQTTGFERNTLYFLFFFPFLFFSLVSSSFIVIFFLSLLLLSLFLPSLPYFSSFVQHQNESIHAASHPSSSLQHCPVLEQ